MIAAPRQTRATVTVDVALNLPASSSPIVIGSAELPIMLEVTEPQLKDPDFDTLVKGAPEPRVAHFTTEVRWDSAELAGLLREIADSLEGKPPRPARPAEDPTPVVFTREGKR